MDSPKDIFLYSLTLQKPGAIHMATFGNFSAPKAQEVIICRGNRLELHRMDEMGRLQTILSVDAFATIRAIHTFRLPGSKTDHLLVSSDSGRIAILEYKGNTNEFKRIHLETYGKTGSRRIVPGQYLAVDPKGRAFMIAAVEKQKLVYILNRDTKNRVTISSPLEGHKSHMLCMDVVGIDVGYDNPVFVAIEMSHGECDRDPTGAAYRELEKKLTFYELDLGLNHVVRKWSDKVERTANKVIPIPSGNMGPGGVLVCSEDRLTYVNPGMPSIQAPIPRRQGQTESIPVIIIAYAMVKKKKKFFLLLQSDFGDLYKVSLTFQEDSKEVTEVSVKYFDTVPPAVSLCVMTCGLLFVASEFGNHALYQFIGLSEDDDEPCYTSTLLRENPDALFEFRLRPPRNLERIDDIASLSPVTAMHVMDLPQKGDSGPAIPQILCACGRAHQSSLKILNHGVGVFELGSSELPEKPTGVWCVKRDIDASFHDYILVSFPANTVVLGVGETMGEVTDSGFMSTVRTLYAASLANRTCVQVHSKGIHHLHVDGRVVRWSAPGGKEIVAATSRHRQVVVGLEGGEIVYFELDESGALVEKQHTDVGSEIGALGFGPLLEGMQRTKYLSIGCLNRMMLLCSIHIEEGLEIIGRLALDSEPESITMTVMQQGIIYLYIGMRNGVLQRTSVDPVSGELRDTRMRFLGSKPAKTTEVEVRGNRAVVGLSSRNWLAYHDRGHYRISPISCSRLDHVSFFSSEDCVEGMVGISGKEMMFMSVDRLDDAFNQRSIPLRGTPRHVLSHPVSKMLIVSESDHRSLNDSQIAEKKAAVRASMLELDPELSEADLLQAEAEIDESSYGPPKGDEGQWVSRIRLIDVEKEEAVQTIEMEEDVSIQSMCLSTDASYRGMSLEVMTLEAIPSGDPFLVIGGTRKLKLRPKMVGESSFIRVYGFLKGGRILELVHETEVEDIPQAIAAFRDRIIVGVGQILRMYEIGKKQCLRKTETAVVPNRIVKILTHADRVFVADVQSNMFFFRYNQSANVFNCFADTFVPRWVTCITEMDMLSIAGADKFGNFYVSRLSSSVDDSEDEVSGGDRFLWKRGQTNGANQKAMDIINFHVGDVITSLRPASLVLGGVQSIIYSTIGGSIGAFVPFSRKSDVEFFKKLEELMRQETLPLCGMEHMKYRSLFVPVRNVVDGDFVESFTTLPREIQDRIADELEFTPMEIAKKVEDFRNLVL
eukprot:TRINITY_DN7926_c0_g1_i1.p1 TRINITY_DN7926_c0_g1~~TRINITY_DN7926_c0_g1_i1.p1  ORF type:complete len:1261 (+),score=358.49 TRINITY_DN7926_c0_g1_i1:117-3785(+)